MKVFMLSDGMVEAIVLSDLSDEEVIKRLNKVVKEKYPPDIEPDFKIDTVEDVVEGGVLLKRGALSNKEWWGANQRIKRYFANIAKQVETIKIIDPPFKDRAIRASDRIAIESYPDGSHKYIFIDPMGYELKAMRGTFGINDRELYFIVQQ